MMSAENSDTIGRLVKSNLNFRFWSLSIGWTSKWYSLQTSEEFNLNSVLGEEKIKTKDNLKLITK